MSKYYSGRVNAVIHTNASQGFYILKMVLDAESDVQDMFGVSNREPVTVKGTVPGMDLQIGSWFGFEARWDKHPTHGPQLAITKAPVIKDGWTPDMALSTLSSYGVTESVCNRLKDHFGDKVVVVLDRGDENEISTAPGISLFSAAHIVTSWKTVKAYFTTLAFLTDAEVPKHKIGEVWAYFGDDAKDVLSTNPWRLVEIDGIKFSQADEVALRLGLDMGSDFRVRGAVLYACKTRRGMGHLYLSTGDMVMEVQDLVRGSTHVQVADALKYMVENKKLVIDRTTRPGVTAIYEPWMYELEVRSAKLLSQRMKDADPTTPPKPKNLREEVEGMTAIPYLGKLAQVGEEATAVFQAGGSLVDIAEAALESWCGLAHITLSRQQFKGALNALTEPVSILTGLPGTGKTTTIKAIVSVLQDAGVQVLLCAPTGIAAKRIASVTGAPAFTIHRAFGAKGWNKGQDRESNYSGVTGSADLSESSDGSGERWDFNENNPHPADVIIIDEMSMVDQHLMYRLLSSTRTTARIVLVGDAAQLPSVGPGNVLRDMINSARFPTINLMEIFRQQEQSDIVLAAHSIFRGETPVVGKDSKSDFVFIELMDDDSILDTTVKLATRLYNDRKVFQVLSPRHSGDLGVTNLNARLRDVLNPKGPALQEMRLGNETVREGDRVMVVKNDYKHGIFNGDVGKVSRLDRKSRVVEIKLHGPPVVQVSLPFKDAPSTIRLAYAMTVHKCVHPDTLVESSEGLLPIRDIRDEGVIATPDGERPYHSKVLNGEGDAVRITTRGGYGLTATPDHGVDVWDGTAYVRKEAGDVQEGDILRLRMGVTCEPTQPVTLPVAPTHDVRATTYALPTVVDEDFAEFLGLMVADGTVYARGFRMAKRHEDVTDRFEHLCRKLFGVGVLRYYKLGAYHAEVNSTFLSSWLLTLGGLSPNDKAVPECILRSPSPIHARFLRGLFEDGAVALKGGNLDHIEWTSKFETLSNVVRTMLLRLGIPCGTVGGRNLHTLYVYGKYAHRFGRVVGFCSLFKQGRLDHPCAKQTRYFVPVSKAEARQLRASHLDVLGHSTCGNVVQRGRLSLHHLDLLEQAGATSDVVKTLQERATYHHAAVTTIEATTCPSMCVAVPDGHRFLQNGFSAWNSQGMEYDYIIVPMIRSFDQQLQRNLFYTAITRAKKRVFIIGQVDAMVRAIANDKEDARNTLFRNRIDSAFTV